MTSDLTVFITLQFNENPVNGLCLLTRVKNGRSAIKVEPHGNPNVPGDWIGLEIGI